MQETIDKEITYSTDYKPSLKTQVVLQTIRLSIMIGHLAMQSFPIACILKLNITFLKRTI